MRVGNIRRPLYAIVRLRSGYPDRFNTTIIPAKRHALVFTNGESKTGIRLECNNVALSEIICDFELEAGCTPPVIESQEADSKRLNAVIGRQDHTEDKIVFGWKCVKKRVQERPWTKSCLFQ